MTVRSTMSSPPGGLWFWEDDAHAVSSPNFDEAVDAVAHVLRETGRPSADPREELLAYMAPRMPRGFVEGYSGPSVPTAEEYLGRASSLAGRKVERFDRIIARLNACRSCPARLADGCLTCRKVPQRVSEIFKGRRPVLPEDASSGVCRCAGTYCMAVASVAYDDNEAVWEGTPPECWRFPK